MLKLHLGSGIKRLKGFLNVDLDPNVNPDIIADLRNLPFDDSSVDEIYACAVIEHFGRHEQKSALLRMVSDFKARFISIFINN